MVVKHQQVTEELRQRIALYALGSLPSEHAIAFADHLAEGCQTCARELRILTSVVSTLGYAATPIPPRPELRTRLLSHIQGMSAERTGNDHGVLPGMQVLQRDWTVVRATEGTWEITGAQGVVTKRLSPVLAQPCCARLVRMRSEVQFGTAHSARLLLSPTVCRASSITQPPPVCLFSEGYYVSSLPYFYACEE